MLERVRKALNPPPLTDEWINMVITDRVDKAAEIEEKKGPKAASRYRCRTAKLEENMRRRRV